MSLKFLLHGFGVVRPKEAATLSWLGKPGSSLLNRSRKRSATIRRLTIDNTAWPCARRTKNKIRCNTAQKHFAPMLSSPQKRLSTPVILPHLWLTEASFVLSTIVDHLLRSLPSPPADYAETTSSLDPSSLQCGKCGIALSVQIFTS